MNEPSIEVTTGQALRWRSGMPATKKSSRADAAAGVEPAATNRDDLDIRRARGLGSRTTGEIDVGPVAQCMDKRSNPGDRTPSGRKCWMKPSLTSDALPVLPPTLSRT